MDQNGLGDYTCMRETDNPPSNKIIHNNAKVCVCVFFLNLFLLIGQPR